MLIADRAIDGIGLGIAQFGHWRDGDSFPVDGRPDTLRGHCEISSALSAWTRSALSAPPCRPSGSAAGQRGSPRATAPARQDRGTRIVNVTVGQLDEGILVTCRLPWPARIATSLTWRTHRSTGHQAGRLKPRSASPGVAAYPYTGSCWPGCGLSHRTSSRSPVPAGLPRSATPRPRRTSLTRTWRTCASADGVLI